MWDLKNIMLFICSIIVVIIISMKMANANPVLNWFESEKQKTIEYQTKAWTKTKESNRKYTIRLLITCKRSSG